MDDVRESIEELRYYRAVAFRASEPPTAADPSREEPERSPDS
jgi:hypothetical protein